MSAASVVGVVRRAAAKLSTDLPPGFTAAVERADKLIANAEALGTGPNELHRVALECLAQDRDPGTDKAVVKAVIYHHLANFGVGQAARDQAERDINGALVEYSDEMLSAWSSILEPHLTELTDAAPQLPFNDLDFDYAAILAKGGAAIEHWTAATEALRLTRAATDAAALLALSNRITLTRQQKLLLVTPADLDAFDELARTGAPVTVWSAARAQLPLRLIDSTGELLDRITGLEQQRADALARAAERPQRPAFQTFP